jgi:hypothetical protein
MEDKIIEGEFTATPEIIEEIKEIKPDTRYSDFLLGLFNHVKSAVEKCPSDFPLYIVVDALNTVYMNYIINGVQKDLQRKVFDERHDMMMRELERVHALNEEKQKTIVED